MPRYLIIKIDEDVKDLSIYDNGENLYASWNEDPLGQLMSPEETEAKFKEIWDAAYVAVQESRCSHEGDIDEDLLGNLWEEFKKTL